MGIYFGDKSSYLCCDSCFGINMEEDQLRAIEDMFTEYGYEKVMFDIKQLCNCGSSIDPPFNPNPDEVENCHD